MEFRDSQVDGRWCLSKTEGFPGCFSYDLAIGRTVITVARVRTYRSLTKGGITASLAHCLVPARRGAV